MVCSKGFRFQLILSSSFILLLSPGIAVMPVVVREIYFHSFNSLPTIFPSSVSEDHQSICANTSSITSAGTRFAYLSLDSSSCLSGSIADSRKCKKMKLSQDMQLFQKLRDDQKRMKKVFEVMSGSYEQKSNQDRVRWRKFLCHPQQRMIPEPGDANREVPVPDTFHEQTDDELTEVEIKQMEDGDQAIRTILLGLPEDIYVVVDSCKNAQEIWLSVQQMMKGSDIGIQEKKAKLFNGWKRQIAQPGMNIGQDRQIQMVEVQNPGVQNVGNQNGLIVFLEIANQNLNGNVNGNVVAARAEGNAIENNGNQIRCYNCRGLGNLARNCTVRRRRRDAAYLQQ
nr:hypothetical protein [Tanacetum cinerariifolium]